MGMQWWSFLFSPFPLLVCHVSHLSLPLGRFNLLHLTPAQSLQQRDVTPKDCNIAEHLIQRIYNLLRSHISA